MEEGRTGSKHPRTHTRKQQGTLPARARAAFSLLTPVSGAIWLLSKLGRATDASPLPSPQLGCMGASYGESTLHYNAPTRPLWSTNPDASEPGTHHAQPEKQFFPPPFWGFEVNPAPGSVWSQRPHNCRHESSRRRQLSSRICPSRCRATQHPGPALHGHVGDPGSGQGCHLPGRDLLWEQASGCTA